MRAAFAAGAVGLLLALAGCDPSGNDDESGEDEGACGDLSRADEYEVGLSRTGENGMTVAFVDAAPAPPFRSDNTWVLMVEDADGNPIDEAEWEVFPWMPDHGHGTPVPVVVTKDADPGVWTLDPLNLHMAGFWTIDLTVKPTDGQQDVVQFAFCIP